MTPQIQIFTDGSCSKNPGPGGWAAIILRNGESPQEIFGSESRTTNNRMELFGVIAGLECLQSPSVVVILSDSAYIVNCFLQNWHERWARNSWLTSKGKPVENQDLWQRLLGLVKQHTVTFQKVKGHASDAFNNRCDELARAACLNQDNAVQGRLWRTTTSSVPS